MAVRKNTAISMTQDAETGPSITSMTRENGA